MRTLNIIGCGKVGKTIGYLLIQSQQYQLQNILTRSQESAMACQNFFGAGQPVSEYKQLIPADVFFIATNDDQLPLVVADLLKSGCLKKSSLVFHCSGSFTHEILLPLKSMGVLVASIHPVKSFSNPQNDIGYFPGTFCTLEGDKIACEILQQDFENLGAKVLYIATTNKIHYHVATIFSSNYFVTLIDTSLQLLEQSDISREEGIALLEPLILGAFSQVKELGTIAALTGPIARGDKKLIEKQLESLLKINPKFAHTYKVLGKLTLDLAVKKGHLTESTIDEFKSLLI